MREVCWCFVLVSPGWCRVGIAVAAPTHHHLVMEPVDRDDDPNAISPMTDEEAELFRRLRFGSLPPPVAPEDMVAEVDTRHLQPEDPAERESRNSRYPG